MSRKDGPDRPNRPATFAPKGTSLGLWTLIGLAVLLPMIFGFIAVAWGRAPLDAIVYLAGAGALLAFADCALIIFALRTHRWSGVLGIFGVGIILLLAYAADWAAALALPLGLMRPADGDSGFLNGWAMGLLVLSALPVFWLIRLMSLRYWQPWTRPEQWESGDETRGPAWAGAVTNLSPAWRTLRSQQNGKPAQGGKRSGGS
jgi:hypothetical protein